MTHKMTSTCSYKPQCDIRSFAPATRSLTRWLSQTAPFTRMASVYTFLLEENVSAVQAVHIFYAQLSAIGVFLPFSIGAGWRACFLVLFAMAASRAFSKKRNS